MANKGSSVYTELFEQLAVPERLEPQNIAAMLEKSKLAGKTPLKVIPVEAKITPSDETAPVERNITVSRTGRRTSAVYRSVASVAACAALVLGIYGYTHSGNGVPSDTQPNSSYASSYNDVHKTFEKYYVGDTDSKTLDSAIKDIEHSYNEGDASNSTQTSPDPTVPTVPEATAPSEPVTEPAAPDPVVTEPVQNDPEPAPEPPAETVDEKLPLPEDPVKADDSDIAFGDGFLLRKEGNYLRIITSDNGNLGYTGNINPIYAENSAKTLVGFYAEGKKAVAVYSVVSGEIVTTEPTEPEDQPADSLVGNIIDNLYGAPAAVVKEKNSVEICVYDIIDGNAMLASTVVHGGSLVDMNFMNGALYAVTAYNDYRNAPIIGVDDHESYVPSYTVNGEKYYVEAQDIMLPDVISTTDYAVISGITVDGRVSVKAVLGYEGRVILKSGAVYLFGYDSVADSDLTSVRVFSLSGGDVIYAGFVDIDGVALSGDGISVFGDTIAISSIRKTDGGYVTTLGVYDGTMNVVSRVDFPAALTSAKRDGHRLYLSGAKDSYGVDLSTPSVPVLISDSPTKDAAEGLREFDGGYVTLIKNDKGLLLSKLVKNDNGVLTLAAQTVVCSEAEIVSKALENNGRLFVGGNIVGVPYGYFDGYDYCYRFELYRLTENGFEQAGAIENHELNDAYEPEKAVIGGRVLYVFSDGRIYSAVVGETLAQIGSADIIESAYSGH